MNELHLFAGAGGGILGGMLLGHTCVCAVEIEPYAREVLLQRQRDGILPKFPIWDDVRAFDGKPWRGKVDVVCGGFPCQDISSAGKGKGLDGERSGLWKEMLRIIGEIRPAVVFAENSPMLIDRGGVRVVGELAAMGYNSRWGIIGAKDCGAPHQRDRLWILASDPAKIRLKIDKSMEKRNIDSKRIWEREKFNALLGACESWKSGERGIDSMANGVASIVDEFAAIGNGQVPIVAATAWKTLI